jgi:hypothetical protein
MEETLPHASAVQYSLTPLHWLSTLLAPPPSPRAQTELAERHLQRLWDMEATAAAERMGMDLNTYATLLELQHRDITPEDYDVLQQLDERNKRKVLEQETLDECFPAWRVAEGGSVPAAGSVRSPGGASPTAGPAADEPPPASAIAKASAAEDEGEEAGAVCAPCNEDDEHHCSICLERFVAGQFARSLPCKHTFHVDCIDAWLTQSSCVCPLDGLPIFAEEEDEQAEEDKEYEDEYAVAGVEAEAEAEEAEAQRASLRR